MVLKEHFNFYSSHFFDRALVLLLKSGSLVLYTSLGVAHQNAEAGVFLMLVVLQMHSAADV